MCALPGLPVVLVKAAGALKPEVMAVPESLVCSQMYLRLS